MPSATPGGLVTAMGPVVATRDSVWIGSSGHSGGEEGLIQTGGMTIFPLSLSEDVAAGHYDGFSNQTLWPLCHDVGVPHLEKDSWYDSYASANESFALAVASLAAPGATVWVHDYQLMVVPSLLRRLRDDLTIGYFHHIPFPPAETLRRLSRPEVILEGLLGSDLVGFQISRDAENFRDSVEALGLGEVTGDSVTVDGRGVKVQAFPISLDISAIEDTVRRPEVQARAREIRRELGDPETVFLGVDRVDYTKGIPERLEAFGAVLDSGALGTKDVVFVQAGSPSRESVGAYQDLQRRIDDIVGSINSRHQRPNCQDVIQYSVRNLPREEMLALYCAADVMVVTPLRDGMNLVVKEFVASRVDLGGVVVLSTRAGAAEEMPQALLVDPTDRNAISTALVEAAQMDPASVRQRMTRLREQLVSHDVHRWSESFLDALGGHRT